MKKNTILVTIAIIFLFAALVLMILWRNGVIEKIDPAIITAIIGLGSYIIDFFNKTNRQKHTGSGDNVGGDKMNSPSHSGNGDIIGGDKKYQKHTGSGHNIGTMINNNNYQLPDLENSSVKKYPEISSLTALEIIKKIEESALMQQEETAKNYYGIRVKWRVRLQSIYTKTKNEVKVRSSYEDKELFPCVIFHVNTEKYPNIKVAEKGMVYNITGTIINYQAGDFDLNIEILEELEDNGKYHFV